MEPYFVQNPNLSGSGPGLRVTWLGHATVLVEIDGVNVLTDPIFSQRASPIQYMGPKRFRGPPCTVEQVPIYTYIYFCLLKFFIYSSTFKVLLLLSCQQLPRIDAVVISHSHYDHLDAGSVASLNARFGGELRWYVRWISGPQYYFHSCHMFTSHCQTVCPLLEITCTFLHCVCQVRANGFDGLADEDGLWECDGAGLVGGELCPRSWWCHVCLHTLAALEQTHSMGW